MKIFKRLNLFIILFLLNAYIYGQIKENVEVVPVISPLPIAKNCRDLRLGKVIFFLVPDYPPEAKTVGVGGTVTVNIKLDEKGSMPEIGKVSGHKLLRAAATDAARKVKFTPTVCDQAPVNLLVVMNYNFILYLENDNYSSAVKIEDFRDVSEDSEFYEAILDLTENYRIAFGYADKNFTPMRL
ncbi:MAG: energy transducer TonB [Acidobacteriota bacterium]|nr:energy transducer TonB [Acidobacteriota bacterium]